MYYCCGITEKGLPAVNQDALLLHREVLREGSKTVALAAPFMVAVCDGVSGEPAGDLAAGTCLKLLAQTRYSKRLRLESKILDIHEQIAALGKKRENTSNMQTTLCGLAIDEDEGLRCFNVGDSRLYRYRLGTLEQISRDQTLVQMLYDEGTITSEEKRVHAQRNVVFPVMGCLDTAPKPQIREFPEGLIPGDVLLVCSDGLSDYVTDYEMEEQLAAAKPLPQRLSAMVNLALSKGGRDNITVAAVTRYPDSVPVPLP